MRQISVGECEFGENKLGGSPNTWADPGTQLWDPDKDSVRLHFTENPGTKPKVFRVEIRTFLILTPHCSYRESSG